MKRRDFLKTSVAASAAAGLTFRFEEQALRAAEPKPGTPAPAAEAMPRGRLGKLSVSRLICGGNLTSGFAHSRDLIYVSPLLQHYFTRDKIFETWRLCEEQGINTAILRLDSQVIGLLRDYWYVEGGHLQWISQCKLPPDDWKADILRAVDQGCHAAFVHGGDGDAFVEEKRFDELARAVELIQKNGIPAGIAGHSVEVPRAVHAQGIPVDFFMKTLNAKNYWSAGPMPRHDSVWEETPEETIAFMKDIEKPWIAYKVLGAGAIHPKEGFKYALENGADFLCAGLFDFQVKEDADIARGLLAGDLKRARPWRA